MHVVFKNTVAYIIKVAKNTMIKEDLTKYYHTQDTINDIMSYFFQWDEMIRYVQYSDNTDK